MTAFYIASRIEEEKFIILLRAALKIKGITDQMEAKQTAEEAKKTEQEE